MPYGLRYTADLFWIGPGSGPMAGLLAPSLPGQGGGTGQVKEFSVNFAIVPVVAGATTYTQPGGGTAISGALASADITTLTNAMAADLVTQMNAAIGTMQAWVAGNP
jgi:hypothetical protein